MLTPEAIERAMDLYRLGPLTIEPTLDMELAAAGLAVVQSRHDDIKWTDDMDEATKMRSLADLAEKRRKRGAPLSHGFLVTAHPAIKEKLFNRAGGIRGKWWSAARRSFADYMKPEGAS